MDELKVETVELGISSSRLERSVTPEKVSISRSTENMVNGSHPAKNGVVRKSSLHVSVKTWQRLEVGVLCVVIVIAWGLLCLPIIFYHVPPEDDGSPYSASCSVYEGTICQPFLQNCPLTELINNSVYVSPTKPQIDAEMDVQLRLLLLGPSPECVVSALPFFCQYLLRPCDSNGTVYLPSSADCNVLRSQTCATEWEATNVALAALNQEQLPECEMLPNSSMTCDVSSRFTSGDSSMLPSNGTSESSGDSSMLPLNDSNITTSSQCTLQCRDGFYCQVIAVGKLNVCRPRCDSFEEYPHSTAVATDVFIILSAIASLISGTSVLIISAIRRKQMFTFPSVFVVYMTITLVVLSIFILVGFTDRNELYCSSLDLEESLDEPTPFCKIAGFVFSYTLLQLALWWFFHLATLFWKIQFPLHAKSFETGGYMKYLHIVTVVVGIVLPFVPVITAFGTGGFTISRFPPVLCVPNNTDATFYSLLLPSLIIVAVGITLLIVLFWKIHKQHGLLKAKMMKSKLPLKIGTPERKLLIVFCCYIIIVVTTITAYTLNARTTDQLVDGLREYFVCESTAPEEPCDISSFQEYTYAELTALAYVLLGLFPSVLLVFAMNIKDVRRWCGCAPEQHYSISAAAASKNTLKGIEQ